MFYLGTRNTEVKKKKNRLIGITSNYLENADWEALIHYTT